MRTLVAVVLVAVVQVGVDGPRPARPPDIYYAPSPQVMVNAMLALAAVTPADVVYDLGSGDGRVVIVAAQKYGARGVGVEIDPALVALSRQHARDGAVADRVRFVEGDLFTADIAAATVVTLWLSPSINRDLEARLKRELRPGARVVSRQFPIGSWVPDQTVTVGNESLFSVAHPGPGSAGSSRSGLAGPGLAYV